MHRNERNEIESEKSSKQEMETAVKSIENKLQLFEKAGRWSSTNEQGKNYVESGHAKLIRLMGFDCAISALTVTVHVPW